MLNKETRAALAKRKAIEATEEADAAEQGRDFHKAYPEALLPEVGREASRRFGINAVHQWHAFNEAFRSARAQRDEFLRERSEVQS